MEFSPELLAAAEREFALLSAGIEPVKSDENEFDQELLQNAADDLQRFTPEEIQNLLEAIPPARPPRPKRATRKQRQREREEFECANLAMYNRRVFEGIDLETGRRIILWQWE